MNNYCDYCINSKTEKCKVCTQASFNGVNLGTPTNYKCDESKPPIEIKPRKIHDYQRIKDIVAAMQRYIEFDKSIPTEWAEELWDLLLIHEDTENA